jgi:hypothetical protein
LKVFFGRSKRDVFTAASLDSLRSTVGLSPIEEYLKASSEFVGVEIVWGKRRTVADFE